LLYFARQILRLAAAIVAAGSGSAIAARPAAATGSRGLVLARAWGLVGCVTLGGAWGLVGCVTLGRGADADKRADQSPHPPITYMWMRAGGDVRAGIRAVGDGRWNAGGLATEVIRGLAAHL